jgi:hypothetical protein
MSRPVKDTVNYFPHSCTHGQTMYIIEKKYGIGGYGAWFKILEQLGITSNHFIDCRNNGTLEFLQAITYLEESTLREMLDLLAKLDAIDKELWQVSVIWSQHFVDGIAQVYINRKREIPKRPEYLLVSTGNNPVSTSRNTTKAKVSTSRNTTKAKVSTGKSTQIK